MLQIRLDRITTILLLASAWTTGGNSRATERCPSLAERFKILLGIEGNFDTRLRVERKSTNSIPDAIAFRNLLSEVVRKDLGESASPRDLPPNPAAQELVTATVYPFSRKVQSAMSARIRIREYGVRKKGSTEPWQSTTGEYVSFEVKARTDQEGVVVKPILKIRKEWLEELFGGIESLRASREKIESEAGQISGNDPAVVREALDTLAEFYRVSAKLNEPFVADLIEYNRDAWVVETFNTKTGKSHKVQITFDQAVNIREDVSAQSTPSALVDATVTHNYPDGPKGVMVVEMKSDLVVNGDFLSDPGRVRDENPTYFAVRTAYEKLQENPAPGFLPDSGKAAQLKRAEWE